MGSNAGRYRPRGHPLIVRVKVAIMEKRVRLGEEDRKARVCYCCNRRIDWRTPHYGRKLFLWVPSQLRKRKKTHKRRQRIGGHWERVGNVCPDCAVEIRMRVNMGGWLYTNERGQRVS